MLAHRTGSDAADLLSGRLLAPADVVLGLFVRIRYGFGLYKISDSDVRIASVCAVSSG